MWKSKVDEEGDRWRSKEGEVKEWGGCGGGGGG